MPSIVVGLALLFLPSNWHTYWTFCLQKPDNPLIFFKLWDTSNRQLLLGLLRRHTFFRNFGIATRKFGKMALQTMNLWAGAAGMALSY